MEALALLAVGLAALVVISPILALIAFSRSSRLERELRDLRTDLGALDTRVGALAKRVLAERAPAPEPPLAAAAPPAPPRPAAPPLKPAPAPVPTAAAEAPRVPAPPRPSAPPRSAPADFATSLGPKILVATGALACVVFLALFVKYAWENNWVGPRGRVLFGATLSLGLVAGGLRLLDREYRPLGQGLAGLGFAGLYVSAFGAHGFYDLIPREAAGLLMVAITAAAVVLAGRLDTRLLAALAWVGGYLTPVLLSTGEDRALSLFLYLAVLDAGALVLDRRKPWPETLPLAFAGTMVLYAGWYAQFFRPERFEVAGFGIVLFTALFAFGMARRERELGLGTVLAIAAIWAAALAAGADRPAFVMILSLGLGGAALRFASRLGRGLWAVAVLALALPFVAWSGAHYRPESFGIAAAWVVAGVLLLLWPPSEEGSTVLFQAAAMIGGGLASIVLASQTDRPVALLALLAAQAGIAILFRGRWAWSEAAAIGTAGLAVLAWFDRFYRTERFPDALLLAISLAALYLLALVIRSLVARRELGIAGLVAHFLNATLLWTVLFRVLYDANATALGLASVALATLYLALGLTALRAVPQDALQVRTLLALAAGFLTLAIPVQLGLHGITLAWAIEGMLLLRLGLRFDSLLTRLGGYAVLGLAVLRLGFRHLPLHEGAFRPLLNPSFGIWIAVIAALGFTVFLTREARREAGSVDWLMGILMSVLALVLLFGVLTAETQAVFGQVAAQALQAGRAEAAQTARRASGLALSVLWTLFATGLLAAGLGLRNRALFYSAYGLFAFTAAKVVLVDLATFQTLYRMLSFLALGVLLLAGAYLNLRFRERLAPRESGP